MVLRPFILIFLTLLTGLPLTLGDLPGFLTVLAKNEQE